MDQRDVKFNDRDTETSGAIRNHSSSRRWRKHQEWESHREEIYEIYMKEGNTLEKTIQVMKDKYGFAPRYAACL